MLISELANLNSGSMTILIFAGVLLVFLLVLIIVTVKILKGLGDDDDDEWEEEEPEAKKKREDFEEEADESDDDDSDDDDASDDDDDESDEETDEDDTEEETSDGDASGNASKDARTSESVSEAIAAVEATKERVKREKLEKERLEKEALEKQKLEEERRKAEEQKKKKEERDRKLLEEERRKAREEAEQAKEAAEDPDYDARYDSAFADDGYSDEDDDITDELPKLDGLISETPEETEPAVSESTASEDDSTEQTEDSDVNPEETAKHIMEKYSDSITVNPRNAVNVNNIYTDGEVNTVNERAGISDMKDVENFLKERPVPEKKKRKVKKKDRIFEDKFESDDDDMKVAKHFWYNTQDIENLTKKEDMYFYCHYFDEADDAVIPLITEMYDCAYVRTEDIQRIAYGVKFKGMSMKEILSGKGAFDISKAKKQPSSDDKAEIYRRWCGYVDDFVKLIVINAPDDMKDYIIEKLYEYGKNEPDVLLYSPM